MSGLLETLFALVVVGGALFYALPQIAALSVQPAQNDAGNQVAQMQAAGATYIRNHFTALQSGIAVGANSVITPQALIADSDLPSGFNDFNVFGQHHVLVVAQPTAGTLDGVVFTYGGDSMADQVAIRVAQAGPANAVVILASDPTNFEGAAGGQTIPIAPFANAAAAILPGHIGAHLEPAAYAAEAPFLNRYFTGNIDDNTMHTDLNLDGNDVNKAKIVQATQQVSTPQLADPTTPSYQLTPAGNSQVNAMTATGNLTVNGAISSASFLHLSDASLKDNIRAIDHPIDLIQHLTGHRFTWKSDGSTDIGFVAQEVQQVFPEAVQMTATGKLAVKYDVLAAPLTEAIKQQALQINEQAREIDALKAALATMRGQVAENDAAAADLVSDR